MEFGPFRLDVVSDGLFMLDGGSMFGVVPKPLWSRLIVADDKNRIPMAANCLLVRGNGVTALVDTGLGDHYDEKQHRIYGFDFSRRLVPGLDSLGVDPEDVDLVVQTHLHFDHCGSLLERSASGRYALTFPRAEVAVQRAEWEAALNPDYRSGPSYFPEDFLKAIEESGQLRLLDGKAEAAPGIHARPLSGHTAGHQVVEVRHGRRKAVFLGDFIPTSKHLRLPYIMSFDLFPMTTLRHKQNFLPAARKGRWTLVFEHDHETPLATLKQEADQVVAVPLDE
jgi:glyoxylase-like metal-dependent hydrolase (beta-lactamase superfamily II)